MRDKHGNLAILLGRDGESSRIFMTRVEAAGFADVTEPGDSRVGQVGKILAEILGLAIDPEAHVVLGHAVLHARRSLAQTQAPAVEEG